MNRAGDGAGSEGSEGSFDAAWREIVAHYDEPYPGTVTSRPEVPTAPEPSAPGSAPSEDPWQDENDPGSVREQIDRLRADWENEAAHPTIPDPEPEDQAPADSLRDDFAALESVDLDDPALLRGDPLPAWTPAEPAHDDSRFVPPVPPRLPRTTPARLAAWIATLGAPALLVVLTLVRWAPPEMVTYALIAAFLGGFGFLVATMDDVPRDPWDDGSRV